MNISKLSKFAWAFFALVLGTATVFGQGRRNGNNACYNQNQVCINHISDLSDDQKSKILEMNNIHQKEMAELRDQRLSTADAIEKNDIRGKMLRNVKVHREEVKNLLNEKQQKQYDELFTGTLNNYQTQRGNSNFRGSGQCQGRQGFGRNQKNGRGGNQNFNRGCFRFNQSGKS